jgi:hypothetical protein
MGVVPLLSGNPDAEISTAFHNVSSRAPSDGTRTLSNMRKTQFALTLRPESFHSECPAVFFLALPAVSMDYLANLLADNVLCAEMDGRRRAAVRARQIAGLSR